MFEQAAVVSEGHLGEQVVEAIFGDDQAAIAVGKTVHQCRKALMVPQNYA